MRAWHLSAFLLGGLATAKPLVPRQGLATPTATAPAACSTTTGSGGSGEGGSRSSRSSGGGGGGGGVDMAEAILAIMPSSGTCEGADLPEDCRTAEQAAPFVEKACADAGLNPAETAAVLALMGLESVDFKFKHNVFPGRPGQGTASMMMPNFIAEYATSLFGADKVQGKSPAEVLEMVTPDEHNFGSAVWFLTTKCADARGSLKTGSDEGWLAYMQCVGVPGSDPARMEYWTRAKKAFNL